VRDGKDEVGVDTVVEVGVGVEEGQSEERKGGWRLFDLVLTLLSSM
jgi:hypothetical protein